MKKYALKIEKKIWETQDAVSFNFYIPREIGEDFLYTAGQFVGLHLTIDGKEYHRSYSLSSSPVVDEHFQITVKRVEGGKVSNYLLDHVHEGQSIEVSSPQGRFFHKQDTNIGGLYLFFAAGSGITPVYSIIKTLLATHPDNKIVFVDCNRNENSIIYKKELESLQQKEKHRLHIEHILSQPTEGSCKYSGRLNKDHLHQLVKEHSLKDVAQAYMCGPDAWMQTIRTELSTLGFPTDRLFSESFGVPTAQNFKATEAVPTDLIIVGDKSQPKGNCQKIKALIGGEWVEADYKPDQSLLDCLIEAGGNPPYSCMDGACMACVAKVVDGAAFQKDPGILADENFNNREILTCQAQPWSQNVSIDYDHL